jgi:gamma-glutamyl phosphate reductase
MLGKSAYNTGIDESKWYDTIITSQIGRNFSLIVNNHLHNNQDGEERAVSLTKSRAFKSKNNNLNSDFVFLWNKYVKKFTKAMAGRILSNYIFDIGNSHSENLLTHEKTAGIFFTDSIYSTEMMYNSKLLS